MTILNKDFHTACSRIAVLNYLFTLTEKLNLLYFSFKFSWRMDVKFTLPPNPMMNLSDWPHNFVSSTISMWR